MTAVARLALRRMLVDRGLVAEWGAALKSRRAWRGSDRDAHTRALHMLGDYGVHRALDVDDALAAVELAGEDPGIADLFTEAAARGRERALERELAEVRRVRLVRRGDRRMRDAG